MSKATLAAALFGTLAIGFALGVELRSFMWVDVAIPEIIEANPNSHADTPNVTPPNTVLPVTGFRLTGPLSYWYWDSMSTLDVPTTTRLVDLADSRINGPSVEYFSFNHGPETLSFYVGHVDARGNCADRGNQTTSLSLPSGTWEIAEGLDGGTESFSEGRSYSLSRDELCLSVSARITGSRYCGESYADTPDYAARCAKMETYEARKEAIFKTLDKFMQGLNISVVRGTESPLQ